MDDAAAGIFRPRQSVFASAPVSSEAGPTLNKKRTSVAGGAVDNLSAALRRTSVTADAAAGTAARTTFEIPAGGLGSGRQSIAVGGARSGRKAGLSRIQRHSIVEDAGDMEALEDATGGGGNTSDGFLAAEEEEERQRADRENHIKWRNEVRGVMESEGHRWPAQLMEGRG